MHFEHLELKLAFKMPHIYLFGTLQAPGSVRTPVWERNKTLHQDTDAEVMTV